MCVKNPIYGFRVELLDNGLTLDWFDIRLDWICEFDFSLKLIKMTFGIHCNNTYTEQY